MLFKSKNSPPSNPQPLLLNVAWYGLERKELQLKKQYTGRALWDTQQCKKYSFHLLPHVLPPSPPTIPDPVLCSLQIGYNLFDFLSVQVFDCFWPTLGRKGWHLDLNQLIFIKLGWWPCQLWYSFGKTRFCFFLHWNLSFLNLSPLPLVQPLFLSYLLLRSPTLVSSLIVKETPNQLSFSSCQTSTYITNFLYCLLFPTPSNTFPKRYSLFTTVWAYLSMLFCLYTFLVLVSTGLGRRGNILIWINWYAINWDCDGVNCDTNILHGSGLFGQNKILFFALKSFISKYVSSFSLTASLPRLFPSAISNSCILHHCQGNP